jgi:hypothetical protein
MITTWRRIGCSALIVLSVVPFYYLFVFVHYTIQRLHAYTTQARMAELSGFLREYQPRIVDSASFRTFLRQHDKPIYLRDGCGHQLVVETWNDKASRLFHYRIRALGRSGERSSCCKPIGHNWDLNSVIEDGKWVQVWDF